MRFRERLSGSLVGFVGCWLVALSASALPLVDSSLAWDSGTANGNINLLSHAATTCGTSDGGKAGSCSNSGFTPGHGLFTVNSWSSSYDTDPFVTNNFNVTNNSAGTITFDVIVISPVVVTGPQTAMSGSLGITLTNTTGSATLSDAGASVYRALIDGVVVRTLFDPVYTQTCVPPFCSITNSADFGVFPNPPETGPQANTDIAIRIRFALSPGDSAGVTSVFNIEAVPEPGTATLLGLGLLAIAFVRRRA